MKAVNALVLPLLATAGLALAFEADAQTRPGDRGGYGSGNRGPGSGNRGPGSGNRHGHDGRRDWGNRGDHRHHGSRHHYYHGRSYSPWWGLLWAAPLFWGSYYYSYPHYYGYWGPRYYGRSPYASYPDDYESPDYSRASNEPPVPTTEVPTSHEGAPTQRPLYLNYCESAKAYYPKVTTCPSGWQMRRPQYD